MHQELSSYRRCMPDTQADAFEALVGAIYLDRGFKVASQFLTRVAEVFSVQVIAQISPGIQTTCALSCASCLFSFICALRVL